jgi:hypothetical protein
MGIRSAHVPLSDLNHEFNCMLPTFLAFKADFSKTTNYLGLSTGLPTTAVEDLLFAVREEQVTGMISK